MYLIFKNLVLLRVKLFNYNYYLIGVYDLNYNLILYLSPSNKQKDYTSLIVVF